MKQLWTAIIALSMISLTACSSTDEHRNHTLNHSVETAQELNRTITMPNGDLRQMTASAAELPTFLDGADEQIRQIYQLAANQSDLLQWIPCYCGCGEHAGHRSNLNCFIADVESNGEIWWDDHGTRCPLCLETAVISAQLTEDGKTVQEIRSIIESQYATGFAAPTPTPLPQ